jgi:molybdate transport system regulatory protein
MSICQGQSEIGFTKERLMNDSRILTPSSKKALDLVQLGKLEQAFRTWATGTPGKKRQLSRLRVLLVFLIIRYTGARLNEVLTLDVTDIDQKGRRIRFRKGEQADSREVQIPEQLVEELKSALPLFGKSGEILNVDAAHIRRRFYDCAEAAGIPREMGTPEVIRKSRAVELMQSSVPLPVVQRIMGHSTPNLAASYVHFSEEDIRRVERFHVERETKRKTSARNRFYGKVERVVVGDIQVRIELAAIDGHRIVSVITTHSQKQLGLKPGALIAAEIKAPWVVIYKGEEAPKCTAENQFRGTVSRISKGKINSEIVVGISEITELCSILTEKSRKDLQIKEGESVWAVFNAASVVINVD